MANEYLNNKYLESLIANFQSIKRQKSLFEQIQVILECEPEKLVDHPTKEGRIGIEEFRLEMEKTLQEYKEAQNKLADAFYILADNLAKYTNYSNVDHHDAIQECVMICFEKLDRFKPELGKAFAYLTTVQMNGFRQMYRSSRSYNELKRKYHDHLVRKTEKILIKKSKNSECYRDHETH